MRRTFLKSLSLPLIAAALSGAPAVHAAENFKIMIPANPGGGWDTTGRAFGKALQEADVASSVTYDNKGGAGGTIGLAQFANATKGDPNALILTGAVMVGAIVQNKPPMTLANVTPIARLTAEYNVFVVPADSPIKSMKEVVEQLKKDPGSVKWGGGSKGSTDHISVAMIANVVGADVGKINYVPFRGGGEAAAAILGGHVTVGTSGYSEFEEFIKAGKMRAIGYTAGTRQKGVDVATLKEQGMNVEIANWRGVYGAAGITPAQRQALTEGVVKATRTKSWQDALQANRWNASVLTGDDFARFVDDDHAQLRALMVKLGML